MTKKLTHEEWVERVHGLVGNEYTVLSEYINSSKKIKMKHNICGHEYMVAPSNFSGGKSGGTRCPECSLKTLTKKRTGTHDKFVERVYDLTGEEYSVLGQYINSQTKIEMLHNKCGKKFSMQPNNFKNGQRCSYCNGNRKKTNEQFKKEVFALVGNDYSVLGEYVNNNTGIKMKHNICGYEYLSRPDNFLSGSRCANCYGNIKKTTEKYKKEIYDLVGDEYIVIGQYVNNNTMIEMKHNSCGNTYNSTPSNFLSGKRCTHCFASKLKTHEEFVKEVYEAVKDDYTVLGQYVNAKTKIKVKHNTCGNEYEVIPSSIRLGYGCAECFGHPLKTPEQFEKEVFNLVGDEYVVLQPYVKSNLKVNFKHKVCGKVFPMSPNSFQRGQRCPLCIESRGEKAITEWLDSNNIEYKPQYRFKDCRHKRPLPFDFAIFNNGQLTALIEFDGRQHYQLQEVWGGKEGLKLVQQRDRIKDDYCKKNDIHLIRIPYWDFNKLDTILSQLI